MPLPQPAPSARQYGRLSFAGGSACFGRVTGDPRRLDLLEHVLGGRAAEGFLDTLLPKDMSAFEERISERRRQVEALLLEGRELVERVERLVCALYEVPDDLTEQVIARAIRRSS
jgi:hypothetical protein